MLATLGLVGTLLVLVCVYFLIGDRRRQQAYSGIPGPPALPIIGNLHQLNRAKPFKSMTEWSKQYGPVIKVVVPGNVFVVASGYNAVHEMLVEKGVKFGGRPRGYRDTITTKNTGILRMSPDDKKWRTIRTLVQGSVKAFGSGINRIEHYAMQMSEEFVQTFLQSQGQPTDPLAPMQNATLRMITLMLYGQKLDTSSPIFQKIKDMVHKVDSSFHLGGDGPQLDTFPWLRYFGNQTYKLLVSAKQDIDAIWNWYLVEVATKDESELEDNMGKPLVKVMKDHNIGLTPEDENFLTDDMIKATCIQMTFAGVLSTTYTLYEIIFEMLHYPHFKKRLQKEVDEVIGDRLVTLNDRDNLHYVQAFIYEVLRYNSGGPLGIPHSTLCDTTLQGYHIPKDTVVLSNLWSLHTDAEFWGDPGVFRPERFLDEDGHLLSPEHEVRKHFMMFGNGTRVCAGKLFALYRLFLWTVTLVQRFDILPDDVSKLPSDDIDHFNLLGVTLRPPPYKARFISRAN